MVKVYLPPPLSVSFRSLPSLSVTVRPVSWKPSSGWTVMVTVLPLEAFLGLTVTAPFSTLLGAATG